MKAKYLFLTLMLTSLGVHGIAMQQGIITTNWTTPNLETLAILLLAANVTLLAILLIILPERPTHE